MRQYEELRVRVRRVGIDRYVVFVNGPVPAAAVVQLDRQSVVFSERFNDLLQEEFGQPSHAEPMVERMRKLGRDVFTLLFGDLERCLDESFELARRQARGLRVRLDLPPELSGIPFETLCAPVDNPLQQLALSSEGSLVRSVVGGPLGPGRMPTPEDDREGFSLLVVVARPDDRDLSAVEPNLELQQLEAALPNMTVKVDHLGWPPGSGSPRASREQLRDWLDRNAETPAALLLVAHGVYENGVGAVLLEREDGSTDRVPAHVLASELGRARRLRLVVLNICAGGRGAPTEPFSGLAQAIVGTGVPAVVAMQADVSDAAAARFSPVLFKGVCSNRTIDQAVANARTAMAQTPEGTTIEWATPALFLHKDCYHGWLFKAREVVTPGRVKVDPLRQGLEALQRIESGRGDVLIEDLLEAARHKRNLGDWHRVLELTRNDVGRKVQPQSPEADLLRLAAEARADLAVEHVERICEVLSYEGQVQAAHEVLDAHGGGLAEAARVCLLAEVEAAERLGALLRQAEAAAAAEDWEGAVEAYTDLLQERPGGYRGAAAGCEAAREQLIRSQAYRAAEAELDAGHWEDAAARYAVLAEVRPDGYRDAAAKRDYAGGRHAEEQGDWPLAGSCYRTAEEMLDAPTRLAYAEGMVAEASGDWRAARRAFDEARARGHGDGSRLAYATGRAAEEDKDWEEAIAAYGPLGQERDAPARLLWARGRLAMRDQDWLEALSAFEALDDGPGAAACLRAVREQLHAQVAAATREGRWRQAAALLERLPEREGDDALQRRYVRGRVAEEDALWDEAVEAFASLSTEGYADSDVRWRYATACRSDAVEDWNGAAALLEELPQDHLDVRDRLLYALGRAAEARGDWPAVIRGFGRLPEGYRDDDVGRRRSFARGSAAAIRQDWSVTLEALRDLTDDYHDGHVGLLRCQAEGRLAEARGDWESAAAAYGRGAGAGREASQRWRYASARAAERADDWTAAHDLYESIDPELEDVAARRSYSRARLAELEEDWLLAAEAYEPLEADFWDSSQRLAYARARAAVEGSDWSGVLTAAEELGDYRDAPLVRAYAGGRQAEAAGDWELAAEAYADCQEYGDATPRGVYARGRARERRGEWTAALDAYGQLPGDLFDTSERSQRLRRLRDLVPWADGLASAALVEDPYARRTGETPYQALGAIGITPSSLAEAIHDASFALLELRAMTSEALLAWDRLRSRPNRLKCDAGLYVLADPDGLREAQQLLPLDRTGAEVLDDLCGRLPTDAPLFMLLGKGREAAIAAWERRLQDDTADVAVAHSLAVAHSWLARELEDSGAWEHADTAWQRGIAHWTAVLTDERHWDSWKQGRTACYGRAITRGDIARLRRELGRDLLDYLVGYADRHAAEGQSERAGTYRRLSLALQVELVAAQNTKDTGGLPLPGTARGKLACGPIFVSEVGLGRRLAEWIVRLEASAEEQDDLATLATPLDALLRPSDTPDPVPQEMLQRLRCSFSRLANAAALLEHQQPEQALQALSQLHGRRLFELPDDCQADATIRATAEHQRLCEACRGFLRDDPAYLYLARRSDRLLQDAADLAVRAHLAITRALPLADPDALQRRLAEWSAAIDVARSAGIQVRAKQAIVRQVLGLAVALSRKRGAQLGQCLDEAVELIERVLPLVGGVDSDKLLAKESWLLVQRGIWHGYECEEYGGKSDYPRAIADLRQAVRLKPDSLYALDNLARGLISRASDAPVANRGKSLFAICEPLRMLHEALLRTSGDGQLRKTLLRLLNVLENRVLHELDSTELLRRFMNPDTGQGDGDAASRVSELLAGGNMVDATLVAINGLRRSPGEAPKRQLLLETLEHWRGMDADAR
jgi:cellulose synthase operon protein C